MIDPFSYFPFALFGGLGALIILVAILSKEPGLAAIGIMAFVVGLCLVPFPPAEASGPAANATPTSAPIPCLIDNGWNCTYLDESNTSAGFVCIPKSTQGAGL